MTAQESVVTPERLSQGISWTQWMEQIDRNEEKFQYNYDAHELDAADVDAIKSAAEKAGGITCLAIGEAWCPDVVRGLPVAAKLAEATGMDLKIFFRDQNLDIMNEFLYKGEFQSIPTLVFYGEGQTQLGVWHERAQKARDEMPIMGEIRQKMQNQELSEEERAKYMKEYEDFQQGPVWAGWRDAEVKEIRDLLEAATK
jgi:thiol-disulfide isomerase/thioredoxin